MFWCEHHISALKLNAHSNIRSNEDVKHYFKKFTRITAKYTHAHNQILIICNDDNVFPTPFSCHWRLPVHVNEHDIFALFTTHFTTRFFQRYDAEHNVQVNKFIRVAVSVVRWIHLTILPQITAREKCVEKSLFIADVSTNAAMPSLQYVFLKTCVSIDSMNWNIFSLNG